MVRVKKKKEKFYLTTLLDRGGGGGGGLGTVLCTFPLIPDCLYKAGNVLFNDTLNTFYLQLYAVRHMVKDHSDNERGNLLPHELLFLINSKGSFICTFPQTNAYHSLCYTSRGALAGTRNISMSPFHEGSIQRPITL